RLLTLERRAEGLHLHHERRDRRVQRDLALLEIREHADARGRELLQYVAGLELLATEAIKVADDQGLERCRAPTLVKRGEQAHEPRPIGELSAADAVVLIDVRVVDTPALRRGERTGLVDLTRDRLLRVADTDLLGALTSVDGCDHDRR